MARESFPRTGVDDDAASTADSAVWVDGAVRPAAEARVSALDHGLLLGDGVFETCAVVQQHAFALTRHLRRLARSAEVMGIALPAEELLRSAVAATLEAAPRAGRLRITVASGPGPLTSARGPGPSTLVVAAGPAGPGGAGAVSVVRLPWVRNERSAVTGVKSTSYAENACALAWAKARGASEGLMANTAGDLCEATAANVLVERGGELVTPALEAGPLAGVTRELVLEWGQAAGIAVREARPGELPFSVLQEVADGDASLFLTGSVRGIVPVGKLDGECVPIGACGTALGEVWAQRQAIERDP